MSHNGLFCYIGCVHQQVICIKPFLYKHTPVHRVPHQVISVLLFAGVTAGRSGEVVPTESEEFPPQCKEQYVHQVQHTPFTFYITLLALTLILLIYCVEKCDYPCFYLFFLCVFALVHVTHFVHV